MQYFFLKMFRFSTQSKRRGGITKAGRGISLFYGWNNHPCFSWTRYSLFMQSWHRAILFFYSQMKEFSVTLREVRIKMFSHPTPLRSYVLFPMFTERWPNQYIILNPENFICNFWGNFSKEIQKIPILISNSIYYFCYTYTRSQIISWKLRNEQCIH